MTQKEKEVSSKVKKDKTQFVPGQAIEFETVTVEVNHIYQCVICDIDSGRVLAIVDSLTEDDDIYAHVQKHFA